MRRHRISVFPAAIIALTGTACSPSGDQSSQALAEQGVDACSEFNLELEKTGIADMPSRSGFAFTKEVNPKTEDLWTVVVMDEKQNQAVGCLYVNTEPSARFNIAIRSDTKE